MATHEGYIVPRTDTAANFTANNPTLVAGELAIESNTGRMKRGDGATAWATLPYITQEREFFKSLTVDAPTASDDISMGFTNRALTITKMVAVVRGSSPSITWTLRHSTDRSAAGNEVKTGGTTTTSQTTGSTVTSFDDATIPINSFYWLETTAKSGTVDELHLSIFATED